MWNSLVLFSFLFTCAACRPGPGPRTFQDWFWHSCRQFPLVAESQASHLPVCSVCLLRAASKSFSVIYLVKLFTHVSLVLVSLVSFVCYFLEFSSDFLFHRSAGGSVLLPLLCWVVQFLWPHPALSCSGTAPFLVVLGE